jgi:photosystem II stability/assembly factor-like uncharacterized protein
MLKRHIPIIVLLLIFALQPSVLPSFASTLGDAEPSNYSSDWRATGPPGGDVRGFVIDPNDPNRFYFGTLDGQIYTSSDGAKHWRLLHNFNRPKMFVDNIIVDPRDSKVIYLGTHRHKEPGGFFKTTDGGSTWRRSPELKDEALHSLAQSHSDPNVLFAGTFNGIFRSNDDGETWTQLPTDSTPGLLHVESLAIDPRSANIVYAGTWYLPYKSTDGGKTWKNIRNGIIDDSDIFAIDIDPRDPNHIIASACSGIYETRTAGDSWRKVQGIPSQSRRTRAILQHPSIPDLVFAGTTEGFWRSERGGDPDSWMVTTSRQLEINSIAIHPAHPETVYIGTNNYGVLVSYDGGKNFAPSNGGYSGRFANVILADREIPNRIYATTINTATGGGFFFVSNDDGQTWRPSMRNMPARLISYSVLQDTQDSNTIYLGTNLGVYRSVDRGTSWAPIWAIEPTDEKRKRAPVRSKKSGSSARSRSMAKPVNSPQADQEMVRRVQDALNSAGYNVGLPDGKRGTQTMAAVRRFQTDKSLPVTSRLDEITLAALGVDRNASLSASANSEETSPLILTDAVNALVHTVDADSGKAGILAATNSGLFRSYGPTKGWRKVPYGSGVDSRTSTVSTHLKEPKIIWVGTAGSGVLVSRDGGATWQQISGIPTDSPINVITQDQQRPEYVYVGTKQAFYSSHDGGATWVRRGGDLPFGDFTSILTNPRNGDEIFAGNAYQNGEFGGGVYYSANAGLTWVRIDPKDPRLPSQRIWALAFDGQEQNTLFVGSHSAGVYVVPRNADRLSATSQ